MDKLKISQLLRENFPAPFGFCSIEAAQPYLNCRALSHIPQDARSVIVLTFPYYTGEHPQRNISRYAMIPDYHLVAGEYLKKLDGTYDLIFMDAAKGQYIHWLPDVMRLMHPGSILLSDNVLQEGDLI